MPYVSREKRAYLERTLRALCDRVAQMDDGSLNYVLTAIVLAWLPENPRYADYARAIGALECAKLEMYREQVARHEDAAKVLNGPIGTEPPSCGHRERNYQHGEWSCLRCAGLA